MIDVNIVSDRTIECLIFDISQGKLIFELSDFEEDKKFLKLTFKGIKNLDFSLPIREISLFEILSLDISNTGEDMYAAKFAILYSVFKQKTEDYLEISFEFLECSTSSYIPLEIRL